MRVEWRERESGECAETGSHIWMLRMCVHTQLSWLYLHTRVHVEVNHHSEGQRVCDFLDRQESSDGNVHRYSAYNQYSSLEKAFGHRFLVLSPSLTTTPTWEQLIEGTRFEDTTAVEQSVGSFISIFLLDTAITNAFILQKYFSVSPPHKTILEFRLQLAK